jgi:hypothetical protein
LGYYPCQASILPLEAHPPVLLALFYSFILLFSWVVLGPSFSYLHLPGSWDYEYSPLWPALVLCLLLLKLVHMYYFPISAFLIFLVDLWELFTFGINHSVTYVVNHFQHPICLPIL